MQHNEEFKILTQEEFSALNSQKKIAYFQQIDKELFKQDETFKVTLGEAFNTYTLTGEEESYSLYPYTEKENLKELTLGKRFQDLKRLVEQQGLDIEADISYLSQYYEGTYIREFSFKTNTALLSFVLFRLNLKSTQKTEYKAHFINEALNNLFHLLIDASYDATIMQQAIEILLNNEDEITNNKELLDSFFKRYQENAADPIGRDYAVDMINRWISKEFSAENKKNREIWLPLIEKLSEKGYPEANLALAIYYWENKEDVVLAVAYLYKTEEYLNFYLENPPIKENEKAQNRIKWIQRRVGYLKTENTPIDLVYNFLSSFNEAQSYLNVDGIQLDVEIAAAKFFGLLTRYQAFPQLVEQINNILASHEELIPAIIQRWSQQPTAELSPLIKEWSEKFSQYAAEVDYGLALLKIAEGQKEEALSHLSKVLENETASKRIKRRAIKLKKEHALGLETEEKTQDKEEQEKEKEKEETTDLFSGIEKRLDFLFVEKNVDVFVYPKVIDHHKPGEELTIGDMHDDTIKAIYYLIRNGVLELEKGEEDFDELVAIYRKKQHMLGEDAPVDAITRADYERFEEILRNAKVNNKELLIRFIGDLKADRGANIRFTQGLLKAMKEKEISYSILLSNHDLEYIFWRELGIANVYANQGGEGYFKRSDTLSLDNLRQAIADGMFTQEEINDLYDNYYKEALKLFDYTPFADQDTIAATLYAHAPHNLELLVANADYLAEKYEELLTKDLFLDMDQEKSRQEQALNAWRVLDEKENFEAKYQALKLTPHQREIILSKERSSYRTQLIINLINAINEVVAIHARTHTLHQICPPEKGRSVLIHLSSKEPLILTMWNRNGEGGGDIFFKKDPITCPEEYHFVCGHHKFEKTYCPPNVYPMDNNCGIGENCSRLDSKEYTALFSLSEAAQKIENEEEWKKKWRERSQDKAPGFELLKNIAVLAHRGDSELQFELALYYYAELGDQKKYSNFRFEGARWLQSVLKANYLLAIEYFLENIFFSDKDYGVLNDQYLTLEQFKALPQASALREKYLLSLEGKIFQNWWGVVTIDQNIAKLLFSYFADQDTNPYADLLKILDSNIKALQTYIVNAQGKNLEWALIKIISLMKSEKNKFDYQFQLMKLYAEATSEIEQNREKAADKMKDLIFYYTDQPVAIEKVTNYLSTQSEIYEKFIDKHKGFIEKDLITFWQKNPKVNGEGKEEEKQALTKLLRKLAEKNQNAKAAIEEYDASLQASEEREAAVEKEKEKSQTLGEYFAEKKELFEERQLTSEEALKLFVVILEIQKDKDALNTWPEKDREAWLDALSYISANDDLSFLLIDQYPELLPPIIHCWQEDAFFNSTEEEEKKESSKPKDALLPLIEACSEKGHHQATFALIPYNEYDRSEQASKFLYKLLHDKDVPQEIRDKAKNYPGDNNLRINYELLVSLNLIGPAKDKLKSGERVGEETTFHLAQVLEVKFISENCKKEVEEMIKEISKPSDDTKENRAAQKREEKEKEFTQEDSNTKLENENNEVEPIKQKIKSDKKDEEEKGAKEKILNAKKIARKIIAAQTDYWTRRIDANGVRTWSTWFYRNEKLTRHKVLLSQAACDILNEAIKDGTISKWDREKFTNFNAHINEMNKALEELSKNPKKFKAAYHDDILKNSVYRAQAKNEMKKLLNSLASKNSTLNVTCPISPLGKALYDQITEHRGEKAKHFGKSYRFWFTSSGLSNRVKEMESFIERKDKGKK